MQKKKKMFKINWSKNVTVSGSCIQKNEYIATDENDFEAVITVSEHKNTQPYVSQIDCKSGERHLNNFTFWNGVQIETLNVHKHIKEADNFLIKVK
jgi:hypothetical protein